MRHLGLIVLLASAVLGQEPARLQVRVDARVELMSIIFRLAGNPEYNKPRSKSPYAEDVEKHFGRFRNHPAIGAARELRRTRGVSYDAVMSMAVHLKDTKTLGERVPFERAAHLDRRWRPDEARAFLDKARAFVKETRFQDFLERHEELYAAAVARFEKKANQRAYLDWFDGFFGPRARARFGLVVGMLNAAHNYSVQVREPNGEEEITSVIGVWRFDVDGVPVVGHDFVPMLVHEFCHAYANPLVDGHAEALQAAGRRIFPHRAAQMRRQAYGSWQIMMRESLVRACVVRYLLENDGQAKAGLQIIDEHRRGFTWSAELSKLLGEYEADRKEHPTLNSFMPRIVEFFDELAAKFPSLPTVVAMTPKNGATDVDPALQAIVITFDRPMQDRSWSVVRTKHEFPQLTGQVSYDEARKVFTIPVRLKADTQYGLQLNSETLQGFKSADGAPIAPLEVTFRTRAK